MSQFSIDAYQIQRTSGRCYFTGEPIEPGEVYMAALVEFDPQQEQQEQTQATSSQKKVADQSSEQTQADPLTEKQQEQTQATLSQEQIDLAPSALPESAAPNKQQTESDPTESADQSGPTESAKTPTSQMSNRRPSETDYDLKRIDISLKAWDENKRPGQMFSYWRTTRPHPTAKKKMFIDNSVLYNLFLRLGDQDKHQRLAFRFVLGLILMRKKLLRYDLTEQRTDNDNQTQEWWKLTPKVDVAKGPMGKWDAGNQIELFNPQLDMQQIEQVTEQISEILEAEL